jgi:hypothetical protein
VPRDLHLYSLEASAALPPWAASAGDPGATRDDDLLTAWSCPMGDGKPCAVAFAFPAPVEIRALRLFAGSGARLDHKAHGRPRKVRLHSDEGWVEGELKDRLDHQHLAFESGVRTRALVLEVLTAYPGKKQKDVTLAEVEILGVSGTRRAPLQLNPSTAIFRLDGSSGGKHGTLAWIEEVDGMGSARRVMRGTAVHGRSDDRFLLVGNLVYLDCGPDYRWPCNKSFTLVDRQTRLFYDLGELSCTALSVIRHPEGKGWAFRIADSLAGEEGDGNYSASAVLIEGTKVIQRSSVVPMSSAARPDGSYELSRCDRRLDRALRSWGFVQERPPGGQRASDSCPSLDKKQRMALLRRVRMPESFDGKREGSECHKLGEGRFLFLANPECDNYSALVVVVTAEGKVLARRETSYPTGSRVVGQGIRLIQIGGALHRMGEDTTLVPVYKGALLTVSDTCQSPCG